MVTLVLASHNPKKISELETLLKNEAALPDVQIVSARALGVEEPVEDGATFEENALIKARAIFEQTGHIALADDSGLVVDMLKGAPGVLSARWSGVHGADLENNRLLLAQLQGLPRKLRAAHFVTCCVLVGQGFEVSVQGEMHGEIITEMRGSGGFGYDTIFIPNAYAGTDLAGLTTAELTSEQKNAISHRSSALRKLLPELQARL